MFFQEPSYAAAAAFVLGYDFACEGGVLHGFREWLIVRLGFGNNLAWSALVLEVAFPGPGNPLESVHSSSANEKHAIEVLFQLLREFDEKRGTRDGLRRIFFEYDRWLTTQEWYTPGSPGWIE